MYGNQSLAATGAGITLFGVNWALGTLAAVVVALVVAGCLLVRLSGRSARRDGS
ncbi:hypothetical protein ACFV6F_11565 [Kitasatospora phosalacinea]|uniref:hypothetical protein n=1 Tax=Kitasatospora phosalacinea TaxID=2065 RepID=UPI00364D9393